MYAVVETSDSKVLGVHLADTLTKAQATARVIAADTTDLTPADIDDAIAHGRSISVGNGYICICKVSNY